MVRTQEAERGDDDLPRLSRRRFVYAGDSRDLQDYRTFIPIYGTAPPHTQIFQMPTSSMSPTLREYPKDGAPGIRYSFRCPHRGTWETKYYFRTRPVRPTTSSVVRSQPKPMWTQRYARSQQLMGRRYLA